MNEKPLNFMRSRCSRYVNVLINFAIKLCHVTKFYKALEGSSIVRYFLIQLIVLFFIFLKKYIIDAMIYC